MRMENNDSLVKGKETKKKTKGLLGGMFLAAGMLVLLAAVLAAGNEPLPEGEDPGQKIDVGTQKELGETGLDEDPVDQTVTRPVPVVDSKDTDTGEDGREPEGSTGEELHLPVENGTVLKGYFADELVYSETLQQYVTHEGLDLAAEEGTPVKTVAAGIVTQVYEDDRLGVTVVVAHSDGYKTRYCNLDRKDTAEEGDEVEAGQVIGKVGRTALFESGDPDHLHLEVWKDDVTVDPNQILGQN